MRENMEETASSHAERGGKRATRLATPRAAWRLAVAVAVFYVLAMVVVAGYRARAPHDPDVGTSDFAAFWSASRHLLDTGEVTTARNYLPAFTLITLPMALLPCWLAAGLMTLLSVAAPAGTLLLIYRRIARPSPPLPTIVLLAPVLILLPYIHACLVLGQLSLLLGFGLVLALHGLLTRRLRWTGPVLGLMLVVKPFLAVMLVWLVIKRQGKALVSTIGFAVLFGVVLPMAVMGAKPWLAAHRAYYANVSRRYTPLSVIASERTRIGRYHNQSLAIVLRRLLTQTDAGRDSRPFRVTIANCPPQVPQAMYVVFVSVIAIAGSVVARHPLVRTSPQRAALEYSLFVIIGLLASPIVWTHYYPLLLLPLCLIVLRRESGQARGTESVLCWAAFWIWVPAGLALATETVMLPYLRAAGVHLVSTLFVFVAALVAAMQAREAGPSEGKESYRNKLNMSPIRFR